MASGPKQKIEVTCPRCGETAGTVFAWLETEYTMTFDSERKADEGRISVEVKVVKPSQRSDGYAGAYVSLDHLCQPQQ